MTISELRTKSNMTQADLAEELKIRQSTVSMWERGKAQPRLNMVKKIADVLGVSSGEILRCFETNDNE